MPRVDAHRNRGNARRQRRIMMDSGIMAVDDVRAVAAKTAGHREDGAHRKSRRFAKGNHRDAGIFQAFGQRTSLMQAIDDGVMAGLLLGDRQIHSQTFQPAHFQVLDKLNDPHGGLSVRLRNQRAKKKWPQMNTDEH